MNQEKLEARQIVQEQEAIFQDMPWRDLITYGERLERITTASGRQFLVKTYTFWDMEEFQSGMECGIRVRAESGWRKWWPYRGWVSRGGPSDWFEPHEAEGLMPKD